ncbi:hypothetical protein [Flavobacterium sp. ZT3R18]|nr:hypothetical protein [Flavobacterium sp. ZT3R18]
MSVYEMSMTINWSQLKIIEYQNKIVTDEINTNEDLAIPYSNKNNSIYV